MGAVCVGDAVGYFLLLSGAPSWCVVGGLCVIGCFYCNVCQCCSSIMGIRWSMVQVRDVLVGGGGVLCFI